MALLLWFLLSLLSSVSAYRILLVFHFPSGSHKNLGESFVRHLLAAGHEVTYITPFPIKEPHANLSVVDVSTNIYSISSNALNVATLLHQEFVLDQKGIFNLMMNVTKSTLDNENVMKLMEHPDERFDVVISEHMFNDVYSGFAAVFDCPHIWFYPNEPNYVALSLIDEPTNPAYTSHIESSDVPPFSFAQRTNALWFQVVRTAWSKLYYDKIEKEIYEKKFRPILAKKSRMLPPFEVQRSSASLVFGNSHYSLGQAIRLPQNYIPIGGFHIDKQVPPLPEDLQNLLDDAEHGVIYFSMGSNLKSKDWPDVIKQDLLEVFRNLKQTVLWKLEEDIPKVPQNVHIYKWLPQTSVLAHPNCILFITHGGLLSTTEAVHFGKPIVGIPVFFDQFNNVDRAVSRGLAIKVKFGYNLARELKLAIDRFLHNPRYSEKAKELSVIYHHRLVPPGVELVHWVEHVVKTKGALHLRSPALMLSWYQKMYIDLALLVIAAVLCILYIRSLLNRFNFILKKKKC